MSDSDKSDLTFAESSTLVSPLGSPTQPPARPSVYPSYGQNSYPTPTSDMSVKQEHSVRCEETGGPGYDGDAARPIELITSPSTAADALSLPVSQLTLDRSPSLPVATSANTFNVTNATGGQYTLDLSDPLKSRKVAFTNLALQNPQKLRATIVPMTVFEEFGSLKFRLDEDPNPIKSDLVEAAITGSSWGSFVSHFPGYRLSLQGGTFYQSSSAGYSGSDVGNVSHSSLPDGIKLQPDDTVWYVPSNNEDLETKFCSDSSAVAALEDQSPQMKAKRKTSGIMDFTGDPITVKKITGGRFYFSLCADGSVDESKPSIARDIWMTVSTLVSAEPRETETPEEKE